MIINRGFDQKDKYQLRIIKLEINLNATRQSMQ
jgi:hypothetical protein